MAKQNPSLGLFKMQKALNSQTIQDCYQLPRMNTMMERMKDCKWLSNLDFQSSFTEIGLERSSKKLTAFEYNGNRFMWKRMVMGRWDKLALVHSLVGP